MRTFFYIAVIACGLGYVAFGLAFTALGIYALISSILLGLASLAFLARQKKKENFSGVKHLKIASYVQLFLSLAVFTGGLIYSAFV